MSGLSHDRSAYRDVRQALRMSEEDLDREGRHVFLGHDRLERFLRWAYEHARLHEEDARRALAGSA